MDEDDPSAQWVERSIRHVGVGHHMPNGPLGCDRPNTVNGVGTPHPYTNGTKTKSIDIKPRGKRKDDDDWTSKYGGKEKGGRAESPLTRSVQENFRGFTYHGGESVVGTMHTAMREREALKKKEQAKNEKEEDEEASRSSEDTEKYVDPEISVGRYSQRSSRSRSRKSVTKEKEKSPGKKKGKKHVGFELNEDELDVDGMVAWS